MTIAELMWCPVDLFCHMEWMRHPRINLNTPAWNSVLFLNQCEWLYINEKLNYNFSVINVILMIFLFLVEGGSGMVRAGLLKHPSWCIMVWQNWHAWYIYIYIYIYICIYIYYVHVRVWFYMSLQCSLRGLMIADCNRHWPYDLISYIYVCSYYIYNIE